jgi:sugar lactone lactonase YvrE
MDAMTSISDYVVRGRDILGECPLWDHRERVLWWVDSRAPALKRFDPSSGDVRVLALAETIGSFAFRESEGMIAALRSGLYLLDLSRTCRRTVSTTAAAIGPVDFGQAQ